ncbi:Uncharacterised protein [Chlamydia trachomatis]|nr:Uncharacterised protein [Chlamydia trachomatis]
MKYLYNTTLAAFTFLSFTVVAFSIKVLPSIEAASTPVELLKNINLSKELVELLDDVLPSTFTVPGIKLSITYKSLLATLLKEPVVLIMFEI